MGVVGCRDARKLKLPMAAETIRRALMFIVFSVRSFASNSSDGFASAAPPESRMERF